MTAPLNTGPVVRVLGRVRLGDGTGADHDIAIRAPKARSLLALLAMRPGRVVSTERLVDELWESEPPPSAATALRVHLANLRGVLTGHTGGLAVEHRPPGYVLACDPDTVDATRAEALLGEATRAAPDEARARCDEALALWTGEPYADVDLRGVQAERHRLGELRLDILELRAQARARAAPPDVAFVAELERLVTDAPLRERFTELLVMALYRSGREADALAAYQRLRARLADELGLVPSRALQDLELAVLRQDGRLDWVPEAPAGPPAPAGALPLPTFTGPFVGRADELAHLGNRWHGRAAGAGLLIAGEAGIGKSRLAAEFARAVAGSGATVVRGTCDPERSLPYRPFVEILRQLRAADTALPAALGCDPASGDGRLRFFTTVCDVLERTATAATGGLLVIVEDLHWIDEASAALARFLLETHPALPLFVLGTARSDEPDESPVWTRLRRDLARRDARAGLLELRGLSRDEVATLVTSRSPAASATTLFELTGGNPLLVDELLAQPGEPVGEDPGPPGAPRSLPVPTTVAETVRQRLRSISAPTRRALELAAVAGDTASATVIAAADRVGPHDVHDRCAEAVEMRILVEDDRRPDAVVFRHALVRQAVVDAMPSSRRRHLHVRWATALGEAGPAGLDRDLAIAHHLLAGVPACPLTRAAEAVVAAARRAVDAYAFEEAAGLTGRALTHDDAPSLPPALTYDLLVAQGLARANLGDADEGGASFVPAAEIARADDDPERLATAALGADLPDRPAAVPDLAPAPAGRGPGPPRRRRRATRIRVLSALARDGSIPACFADRRALARGGGGPGPPAGRGAGAVPGAVLPVLAAPGPARAPRRSP